ncbi:MAG: hypothetical protein KJ645_07550, partial [Planctomycetes bacterium]|nr:hypothetical protein [Planctomycetota bacterium]
MTPAKTDKKPINDRTVTKAEAYHVTAFMNVCGRIFNLGALYPPDHFLFLEAMEEFCKSLDFLRGDSDTVHLNVAKNRLIVQSQIVELDNPSNRRIHDLLSKQGVLRVAVEVSVSPREFHEFVIWLSRAARQGGGELQFKHINSECSFQAIQIVRREFGKRVQGESHVAPGISLVTDAVEALVQDAREKGLNGDNRQAFENGIEQAMSRIVKRVELDAPSNQMEGGSSTRSLEEVLKLGVEAIQHAMKQLFDKGEDFSNLGNLFEHVEKALVLSEDSESAKLMIDILRDAQKTVGSTENTEPPTGTEDDGIGYDYSISELKNRIEKLSAERDPSGKIRPIDHRGILCILTHLLVQGPMPKVLTGIKRQLNGIFSKGMNNEEWEILCNFGRDLIKVEDASSLDYIMPHLLETLRLSECRAISRFLVDICTPFSPVTLAKVWPYMVNEILLGLEKEDPYSKQKLC